MRGVAILPGPFRVSSVTDFFSGKTFRVRFLPMDYIYKVDVPLFGSECPITRNDGYSPGICLSFTNCFYETHVISVIKFLVEVKIQNTSEGKKIATSFVFYKDDIFVLNWYNWYTLRTCPLQSCWLRQLKLKSCQIDIPIKSESHRKQDIHRFSCF